MARLNRLLKGGLIPAIDWLLQGGAEKATPVSRFLPSGGASGTSKLYRWLSQRKKKSAHTKLTKHNHQLHNVSVDLKNQPPPRKAWDVSCITTFNITESSYDIGGILIPSAYSAAPKHVAMPPACHRTADRWHFRSFGDLPFRGQWSLRVNMLPRANQSTLPRVISRRVAEFQLSRHEEPCVK